MNLLEYTPPPADFTDEGAMDEWFEILDFIYEDLIEIGCMSHDKFWCQVRESTSTKRISDLYRECECKRTC